MYAKVFSQIYDGTLCTKGPWEALVTFQQLLVLADVDGNVDMTPAAISRRTTIPLEIIERGIHELGKPDPDSRTPTEEGRRIVQLAEGRSWGWRVVNYKHYREVKREEDRREYHRQYWHKRKAAHSTDSTDTQPTQQNQPKQKQKQIQKKEIQAPSVPKAVLLADGLTETTADAWIAHRKAKKARLTAIAWAAVKRESAKAGWPIEKAVLKAIERNWTGFEAEWVAQAKPAFGQPALTTDAAESTEAYKARMAREAAQARANAVKPPAAVVELLKRTGAAA